ncbi:MAG: metallophosphoesterase, partial [Bacteroidota bacterium]
MSKFLHISDLHLREINDSPSAKCELNNLAIKRNILLHLRKIVDKEKVDAVFITGDIDYDETCEFFPFLDDIAKKNVHLFMVFGDHDTQSMRKELSRQYHGSKYVHVLSKTSIIAPNDLSFAVFGLGCLPSQIGYKKAFSNLKPYQGLKPCVFLTHPSSPSYNFLLNLNCRYYGFGHIHYQQIKYLKENVVCGRPGAIFSNWDGDGQTWPMGYIVGILDQNGIKVRFKQWPKRIIQTRRLYIPKRRS